jgi:hypothetical protein
MRFAGDIPPMREQLTKKRLFVSAVKPSCGQEGAFVVPSFTLVLIVDPMLKKLAWDEQQSPKTLNSASRQGPCARD